MRSYIDDETVIGLIEGAVENLLWAKSEIETGKLDGKPGQDLPEEQRRLHVAGLSAAAMLRAGIPGVPRFHWGRMFLSEAATVGEGVAEEMANQFSEMAAKRYLLGEPHTRGVRDLHMCVCFELRHALLNPHAIKAFKRWKCNRLDRSGRYGRLVRQLMNLQAYARGELMPYPE